MRHWAFTLLLALCLLAGCSRREAQEPPGGPDVRELVAQLQGRSCRYSSDYHEVCRIRETALPNWLLRHPERSCISGAARCLERLGPVAREAVPALLNALKNGPNDYDTGDGYIATRSHVAAALGAISDPRAIDALAESLRTARPADRSVTALPSNGEPAARAAILAALAQFGSAASIHGELVAAVLRERIGTPRETDAVAAAAARALGEFGSAAAVPLLQQSLGSPAARESAIDALGKLKPSSTGTVASLLPFLEDSQWRIPAAKALGTIGPVARPALPRLLAILREPSLAESRGNSIHYSTDATRRAMAKTAAARAVLAIRPEEAAALLAPFRADPDVKHFLRARLSRR